MGDPCWWEAWGQGPPAPPLNPALVAMKNFFENSLDSQYLGLIDFDFAFTFLSYPWTNNIKIVKSFYRFLLV